MNSVKLKPAGLMVAAALFLSATIPVSAHHAFAAEYDVNQPIDLKGTLAKLDWVNPHSWLYIDVAGSAGAVTQWRIEANGPNALLRRGVRKTDFPVGVELHVKGYRAKNGKPVAISATIQLPDGRTFLTATPGTGAPESKDPIF